jgi:hypothetical protein
MIEVMSFLVFAVAGLRPFDLAVARVDADEITGLVCALRIEESVHEGRRAEVNLLLLVDPEFRRLQLAAFLRDLHAGDAECERVHRYRVGADDHRRRGMTLGLCFERRAPEFLAAFQIHTDQRVRQ